ncbi:hypothetical protein D3C86_1932680 [compost metagenome]
MFSKIGKIALCDNLGVSHVGKIVNDSEGCYVFNIRIARKVGTNICIKFRYEPING